MSRKEITGWTQQEVEEAYEEHPDDHELDFKECYCLNEIPVQPHGYVGPPRYCRNHCATERWRGEQVRFNACRYHGANREILKTVEKNVKHGMYANDQNLLQNFSKADRILFEQIMSWAEEEGFEEGSPAYMSLESLAFAKVREMRAEKYIQEAGSEVVEKEIRNPETGKVVSTEEDVHPLSDNLRLKKKTIMSMMSELGLTPKSRASIGKDESKADEAETISEMASQALDSDSGEYNPDEFTDGETN